MFLRILAAVITQLTDKNVTLIILFRTRFFSFSDTVICNLLSVICDKYCVSCVYGTLPFC